MKIYTRSGDGGSTGLFGGPRVSKDDTRIEAYGTVDELNAAIGVARATGLSDELDGHLHQIQHELFSIGAELATPNPVRHKTRVLDMSHVERLEQWIDQHESGLPPLKQFILPMGTSSATTLHLARAICRRAERRVIQLARRDDVEISEPVVAYLNRLSDLLFVMTRVANQAAGVGDVPWVQPEAGTAKGS